MAGIELAAGKHVSGRYPWNSQPLKLTGHEYVFLLHKLQSIITVGTVMHKHVIIKSQTERVIHFPDQRL